MHVAIDDTYGPEIATPSQYVTGARRTYVAVEFPDQQVAEIRTSVRQCLDSLPEMIGIGAAEFHFVDIYNRKGVWENAPTGANLALFSFFANIYCHYNWRVHVQTVDERTLKDHNVSFSEKIDDLDLAHRDGQALLFLLVKMKGRLSPPSSALTVRIDAGRRKPGTEFAAGVFREWGDLYDGRFDASDAEPLIQIADFLAFAINRSTHLCLKDKLTDTDRWFLNLIGSMNIRSDDLIKKVLKGGVTTADFDAVHEADRRAKGLKIP